MFKLQATLRDAGKKLIDLRKGGNIPAVFYGMGKKSTPISISEKDFVKIWKEAGESSTITLETPEGKLDTMIHDVQVDPVRGNPIHADFLAIDVNKEIEVAVQLEFIGISNAVKTGLGSLTKVLHELEVKALPKDLPHFIEVDITPLATLEDKIHVRDITIPKGITLLTDLEEVVAVVQAAKEEKEEVAPVDLSAIEVSDQKGKKEEEGGEAAEAPKAEKE